MIKVLYFSRIREIVGRPEEQVELPSEIDSVGGLVKWMCDRGEPWLSAIGEGEPVLVAVNQEFAKEDTPVKDEDEIAFFPPVTGG